MLITLQDFEIDMPTYLYKHWVPVGFRAPRAGEHYLFADAVVETGVDHLDHSRYLIIKLRNPWWPKWLTADSLRFDTCGAVIAVSSTKESNLNDNIDLSFIPAELLRSGQTIKNPHGILVEKR